MRCVAIRHDASMHIRERIVTERPGTDEKRIRVGRALVDVRQVSVVFVFVLALLHSLPALSFLGYSQISEKISCNVQLVHFVVCTPCRPYCIGHTRY